MKSQVVLTLGLCLVTLCGCGLCGCGRSDVSPIHSRLATEVADQSQQTETIAPPAMPSTIDSDQAAFQQADVDSASHSDDDTTNPMSAMVATANPSGDADPNDIHAMQAVDDPSMVNRITADETVKQELVDDQETELSADPLTVPTAQSEQDDRYRIWVPTCKGPLLIGLQITIDDVSLRTAFDDQWKEIRRGNQDHGDEAPNWEQVFERVAGDTATFGSNAAQVSGQEKAMMKQYDRDKDGIADDDELVRFLFRESNVSGEFRLFGTDAYRYSNRTASALLAAIDQNHDRAIDSEECLAAESTLLRQLDRNADGCIDFSEVVSPIAMNDDPWQRSRFDRQGNIAMDLAGFVNWSNLSYAMGGMVETDALFSVTNPVRAIDANDDQWISVDEAAEILKLEPAFTIVVNFSRFEPASLSVDLPVDPIASPQNHFRIEPGIDSQWIVADGIQIGLFAHDTPTNQNRLPREVFLQLDVDKDGGIDQTEIPAGAEDQLPFDDLDTDQDGKLSFVEINQTVTRSESIWNVQVRGRAAEHPDAMFAWLDRDHDQFLSSREIHAAGGRLQSIMKQSTSMPFLELPETVLLQFGRGEPSQDSSRFQITRRRDSLSDDRPQWAIRMDANRDGDISENEFIGPIDSFRRFDSDEDHFLSVAEIYSIQ